MAELNEKGQKIKVVPTPNPEIGVDTENVFADSILAAAQVGGLDVSSIDALSQSAQNREQVYELIDSMATDEVLSAVLETYAEDSVEPNDKGESMWIEAEDSKILDYTSWLLESLNVDKHLYEWAYCLVTYGDVYIRLYRQSDYDDDILFKHNKKNKLLNESRKYLERKELESKFPDAKNAINEDVTLKLYSVNDPYIPYVEMVPNPGEMFDLQKFGKTYGYIKAPIRVVQQTSDELTNYLTRYKMHENDVEVYDAMSFAHGCLDNTSQRQPETVDIYLDSYKDDKDDELRNDYPKDLENRELDFTGSEFTSYNVKRGQSILYNLFRVWRQLNLLEMSALLNRLTKSSLVRILNVNVTDMPKEQVRGYIQRLKEKIEQKSAIDTDKGMAAYNNPGPIENTIYVPTYGEQGAISIQNVGGDFDPKSLVDLEYFRDRLFGGLKVPKQFFGFTEDGAGFNGGQSLTILSSRYGKTVKKVQNVLCQLVTDIINLFLIDRGLENYVNKFHVRMQTPITQEELDRRQNNDNRLRYIGDIMNQLGDIDDKTVKLSIYTELLGGVINNPNVVSLIQKYIDKLAAQQKQNPNPEEGGGEGGTDYSTSGGGDFGGGGGLDLGFGDEGGSEETGGEEPAPMENAPEPTGSEELPSPAEVLPNESFYTSNDKDLLMEDDGNQDSYLPSPDELGL